MTAARMFLNSVTHCISSNRLCVIIPTQRHNMERRPIKSHSNHQKTHRLVYSLHLRELILRALLDVSLDPEQESRLPLVELAHLVVCVQLVGVLLLVALLDGLHEVDQQLVLPLAGEAGVHVDVLFESALGENHVLVREVADARLEEILLDAVAHQIVVNGLLRHLLVVLNGLLVFPIERGDVGYLEPELVCEATGRILVRLSVTCPSILVFL